MEGPIHQFLHWCMPYPDLFDRVQQVCIAQLADVHIALLVWTTLPFEIARYFKLGKKVIPPDPPFSVALGRFKLDVARLVILQPCSKFWFKFCILIDG